MDRFAALTGRHYHLFDYDGPADAERVLVLMGSGAETARDHGGGAARSAARRSACCRCGCTGRWAAEAFLAALPDSVRAIAVLEQTKEPGATGEPLYLDVVTTLAQAAGGRHAPHAARDRRALRPVVEGFHPGDGEGGVRRTDAGRSRATASPSASTTT